MISLVIAALAGLAWLYLGVGRGGFWRGREDDRPMHAALAERRAAFGWPRVTAIVPARNEAGVIGTALASLLAQRYAGEFSVVVVDDHSDDGTAAIAARAALNAGRAERLTVLAAPPLPAVWTGKLWAVAQGVAHADGAAERPDYLLLTDADICYEADAVSALVLAAVDGGQVLSSLMVRLRCESAAERALIPAFVFFFQMLYPFAWVGRTDRRTAAAAGGCMLVDDRALAAAGGIASIRAEIIDDCALGRRLKRMGPIHLALGERVRSLRSCPDVGAIRRMVVRSAYAQLRYSIWRLAFVVAAMLVVFIAPVAIAIVASGPARALALLAWLLMALLFAPTARRYRVPLLSGLALPAIAATYLAFTIESAVQYHRGRGGLWKGRVQAGRGERAKVAQP